MKTFTLSVFSERAEQEKNVKYGIAAQAGVWVCMPSRS
ncbi:MAG: hypothetical protein JWP03_3946, partial [Phycisphaerales bacterium]|nr:hypothetical protein [Phycisphaerales bacterium]